jgi:cobalt/nickel transport protein
MPGIPWTVLRIGLAGVLGSAIMMAFLWGALWSFTRIRRGIDAGTNPGEERRD